jgi:pilus assembly protein Flp/PilA
MSSATRGPTRTGNSQQQALQIAAQEDDMNALVNFIAAIRRDNEGQDLLEYALLVALIALVSVLAVTAAGTSVKNIFQAIADAIPVPSA